MRNELLLVREDTTTITTTTTNNNNNNNNNNNKNFIQYSDRRLQEPEVYTKGNYMRRAQAT